jgi:hypothetical protein
MRHSLDAFLLYECMYLVVETRAREHYQYNATRKRSSDQLE